MQSIAPAIKNIFFTSVGKKILTALTGLFLVVFLLIHLLGNLTLYAGPELFNLYAYTLTQNAGVLLVLEIGLATGFLMHIFLATYLTFKNKIARPRKYKKRSSLGMSTIYSSNMGLIGIYLLFFLIVHIRSFRFGEVAMVELASMPGVEVRDLYTLVAASFSSLWYALFYVVAMFFLAGHLHHGFASAFKSLGLYSSRFQKPLRFCSATFAFTLGAAFASIPIYFYFKQL